MKTVIRFFTILSLVVITFNGCNSKEEDTIKIGFVAGLSGKYSSLGTSIRDGFLLAFDEVDYKINDKKIVIIEKDDKQDKNIAKKAIDDLINRNIHLVVGNATSSMTKVSFDEVNKHKNMLLISPTASSSEFSRKDDNFIRIQVENSEKSYKTLLSYINKKGYKNIFVIYDSKNISYTNGYTKGLQDMIVKSGGNKYISIVDINEEPNEIVNQLQSKKQDLILIVGNSIDTSNIIQYIRYKGIMTDIMGSGWAKTMDFITNGGRAVEGVVFSTAYDDNFVNKEFIEFINNFEKKYNKRPSVFAAQGYELAKILIQNLQNSTEINTLKNRILKIAKYDGLQGAIVFDKYGDISREYFMMKVINNSFQKIE